MSNNNFEKKSNEVETGKNIAIVAYFFILGTIIAMFMNIDKKNQFASFHIRQALGLNIVFYALAYLVGNIDNWMASAAFYLCFLILWLYGFTSCLQGQKTEIPLLGKYFQNWFKNI
ncbi:hypothetical protein K5I29_06695 [Flavobacterium agricola]|uniref:Chloroplast import component protein (Tic20) n=1 Tax=Flavobacterium agricola TaxID=2870839 RepID=A0ABY6M1Z2_9FLAO|nr:hypothetical protein [Flavobacterium agricola]UYW02555.1 hypothetical protein K5I29_06695 [Flavobacterium agricola]